MLQSKNTSFSECAPDINQRTLPLSPWPFCLLHGASHGGRGRYIPSVRGREGVKVTPPPTISCHPGLEVDHPFPRWALHQAVGPMNVPMSLVFIERALIWASIRGVQGGYISDLWPFLRPRAAHSGDGIQPGSVGGGGLLAACFLSLRRGGDKQGPWSPFPASNFYLRRLDPSPRPRDSQQCLYYPCTDMSRCSGRFPTQTGLHIPFQ